MIFKVLAVFGFMFRAMLEFSFRRIFRPAGLDEILEKDYLNWSRYVLRIFKADLEVQGRENIPPKDGRRLIIVSNHQSQLDIPALVASVDRRLGFVAKKELGSIPLISFWMRQIGCVIIDRADRAGAHRALEKAAKGMGIHPVVVFPEGTRSKDGTLLPMKMGGFRLAILAGARILPVHIEGTRNAGENRPKGAFQRVPIKVRFFPPLDAQNLGDGNPAMNLTGAAGEAGGKQALNRIKNYVDACWRAPADQDAPVFSTLPDAATR